MKKITIEKYIDSKLAESFHVPTALLKMAKTLLPPSAVDAMQKKEIDLEAILAACRGKTGYTKEIEVTENGVRTKVRIMVT